MSCCAINVSTTGSPKSGKMLCLFFNSPLFTQFEKEKLLLFFIVHLMKSFIL